MASLRHHSLRLTRTASAWRGFAAWLCLLAVLLNALVVQPHFHLPHGAQAGKLSLSSDGIALTAAQGAEQNGTTNRNTDTCPWCQAMAQSGTYLLPTPSIPSILPPSADSLSSIKFTSVLDAPPHIHWRSRAPPV